jgi:multimeric flavodoxin WrbA
MDILILNGSPRKNGNSSIVSGMISDALQDLPAMASIIRLDDLDIKPCRDCRSCKSGRMVCSLDDDMVRLAGAMEGTKALIFVTPVYWFGPTSQVKLVIDRMRPYFMNRKLAGKQGTLITVAGTGFADSILVFSMFRKIFRALGMTEAGRFALKAYDEGDVRKNRALSRIIRTACKNALDGVFQC